MATGARFKKITAAAVESTDHSAHAKVHVDRGGF
jgi:hypothetical protein